MAATIVGFSLLVFLVLWLAFAASPARNRWQECRRGTPPTAQRGHLDRHDRVMRNHPV